MRRLLGLISLGLMIHLSVIGSDFACAKHVGEMREHSATPMTGHHHQAHVAVSGSEHDACETPVTPDCCSAVTSCAPTFTGGSVVAVDDIAVRSSRGIPANDLVHPSLVIAPETPPPRV